jgi:hypothetical protein
VSDKKEKNAKPLFYIVQPKITEQEAPPMQEVYRSKKKNETKQQEVFEVDESEKKIVEDEKLEKVKREFGVYDVLSEIESELKSIDRIKDNLHPSEKGVTVISGQNGSVVPKEKTKARESREMKEIRGKINQLLKKPGLHDCEATISGQKIRFQVEEMRDDFVTIKIGSHVQTIQLSELSQFSIL